MKTHQYWWAIKETSNHQNRLTSCEPLVSEVSISTEERFGDARNYYSRVGVPRITYTIFRTFRIDGFF